MKSLNFICQIYFFLERIIRKVLRNGLWELKELTIYKKYDGGMSNPTVEAKLLKYQTNRQFTISKSLELL